MGPSISDTEGLLTSFKGKTVGLFAGLMIVHGLLVKHVEETESQLAARLLDNFDDTAARITKVLPRDYAAVLQTRLDAIEEGLDPDGEEVWSRILEVTGG